MQARNILPPEQKACLESTYTFLQAIHTYLEATLPCLRAWDAVQGRNLLNFATLCQSKLVQNFPEIAEWERRGSGN